MDEREAEDHPNVVTPELLAETEWLLEDAMWRRSDGTAVEDVGFRPLFPSGQVDVFLTVEDVRRNVLADPALSGTVFRDVAERVGDVPGWGVYR